MSFNKFFAISAFILALVAALIGSPDLSDDSINKLAAMIDTEQDHVDAETLAVWIKNSKPLHIVDLRDSSMFSEYHIPGAELMTLFDVVNGGVKRNETIILYSDGGIHSAQAWTLLKEKNFPIVFTIHGGLGAWRSDVLYPSLPSNASEEKKNKFEKIRELSIFFGGKPQISQEKKKTDSDTTRSKLNPKKIELPKFQKEEEKLRDIC